MKIAIRYFSRSGNTKKLANAISEATGAPALTTDEKLLEDVDILFLGSSMYGCGVDDNIKMFIKNIDVKIGQVVNFSTTAIAQSTYNKVNKLLKEKNINMCEKEFHCKGAFAFLHIGRPDNKDLEDARNFVKQFLN